MFTVAVAVAETVPPAASVMVTRTGNEPAAAYVCVPITLYVPGPVARTIPGVAIEYNLTSGGSGLDVPAAVDFSRRVAATGMRRLADTGKAADSHGNIVVIPNSVAAKANIVNNSRPAHMHGVTVAVQVGPEIRPGNVLEALEQATLPEPYAHPWLADVRSAVEQAGARRGTPFGNARPSG